MAEARPRDDAAGDEGHEDVINRIFTAGLVLRSAATLLESPSAAAHVERAVAELDDAIREIREAAFRRASGRETQ